MGRARDHDAIVIGAGHNGLIAAAYLARAGMNTVLVEARDTVGGCASTVAALGGRVNICNCDHLWVRGTPIVDELDLESHGLHYLELDPSYVSMGWNGETPWHLHHGVEQTLDGLAITHPRQVRAYERHVRHLLPAARLVRDITNGLPTPGRALPLGGRSPGGAARLLRLGRKSAIDVLTRFFDDEELIRPALTAGPAVWGVNPSWPGTGLAALGYAAKHLTPVGRPVGGSGAFTDAIHRSFAAAGGTTRLASAVAGIDTSRAGVTGIRLADGTTICADVIVTTVDPATVVADWLDRTHAGTGALDRHHPRVDPATADGPQGYESKVDAFLNERPRYRALSDHHLAESDATVLVSPPIEEMCRAHELMLQGVVAERPMFITNVPSTLDPSLCDAAGRHLLSLEVLWTPRAAAADWTQSKEPGRWLQQWATLLEQPLDELIDRHRVMTPDRYESEFGLRNGHAPSFSGSPLQALRGSPRHLTRYRSAVPGLYFSGAATYPGAGIWGAPGRNAAQVVLAAHRPS